MKINQREPTDIPNLGANGPSAAPKAGAGVGAAGKQSQSGGDQIELGSQDQFVSMAQSAGSAERASQVEGLRALVQSGQYQVDAGALSQAIVSSALSEH
jgi:flagellar biosynthesis anti-sigma factor FlgM